MQGRLAAGDDEARHAALCADVLTQLGAQVDPHTPNPGLPPTATPTPAGALAEQVVFLLCAGEAIATEVLLETAAVATAPGIAERLHAIARDEARHAALGWTVLDTLLDALDAPTRAALAAQTPRQATRAVLAYEAGSPEQPSPEVQAWGVRGRDEVKATARRVLATKVAPKLGARGLWAAKP